MNWIYVLKDYFIKIKIWDSIWSFLGVKIIGYMLKVAKKIQVLILENSTDFTVYQSPEINPPGLFQKSMKVMLGLTSALIEHCCTKG
jgi:hypothetical protein